MNSWAIAILVAASFAATALLTGWVRRYALASDLLDHPNERSSHTRSTPRGGGVAIVITCLAATAVLVTLGQLVPRMAWAVLLSGSVIALLGFWDDRHSIPAKWRFVGHVLAAGWVMVSLSHLPTLTFLGVALNQSLLGQVLAGFFVVWMINLFNFMDGIDGIASVETITVCLGGAVLWALTGANPSWVVAAVLAACAAGFLVWNFPPARIFMGDAGSGFLGLVVATLSLWAGTDRPALFWSWLILCGCFVVDATTTLIRRVRRGEKFHVAHRSHAYQYASRRFGSHLPVTLAVGGLNVFWLFPVAAAVAFGHVHGLAGLLLGYAPLIALAFHFKAGNRAAQELP